MNNHACRRAPHRSPRTGRGAKLLGAVLLAGLALLVLKWMLITMILLAVPYGLWWVIDRATRNGRARRAGTAAGARAAERRAEVESRAVVDAAGGCGWCGSRVAHRDSTGRLVIPREHHREDIELTLATA